MLLARSVPPLSQFLTPLTSSGHGRMLASVVEALRIYMQAAAVVIEDIMRGLSN